MKKVLFLAMVFCFAFAMQSCDEVKEGLSFDRSITVNVNVDTDAMQTTNFKVQTLVESVDYRTDTLCAVKVFDNGKPQIIAVTDSANNLRMLYRGPVSNGATITINAQSTAIAMVTFNPLFGPIPAADYAALTNTIESATLYNSYRAAVDDAISRQVDLTSTNNNLLIASLYNLLRELCEAAFSGQESIEANAIASNSFFNCFPLVASVNENTLTLRTSSNCPSYYGKLTNAEGETIKDNIYVGAAARYGFMDNFSGNSGQNSFGNPTDITFTTDGSYTVTLTCDNQSALLDLYTRLGNNVLAALGADIDPGMLTLLSPVVKREIEKEGIDLSDISSENLMELVSALYQGVIEFMNSPENIAITGEANWQLASTLLVRLIGVYTEIRETTDALLRTSWNIGEENGADTIVLHIGFNAPSTIVAQDNLDIAMVSGNNQSTSSYGTLDNPICVKVREFDAQGPHNAAGKTVNFVVVSGGGSVSQTSVLTNANGQASTNWTLGGGVSGDVQSAYAVVVENGAEVTSRVYFNALISNERYRCSLCCDWADHTNYASQWDLDFAVASDASGVVPLFNSNGRQWDYNGMAERYEMTGTINTNNNYVDMEVAMWLTDPYYTGGTDIHYRTDQYQFNLTGSGFAVEGNLIWDGFDYGQEWGAGCGTYIWLEKIGGNNVPAAKKATPTKAPKGKKGLAARK